MTTEEPAQFHSMTSLEEDFRACQSPHDVHRKATAKQCQCNGSVTNGVNGVNGQDGATKPSALDRRWFNWLPLKRKRNREASSIQTAQSSNDLHVLSRSLSNSALEAGKPLSAPGDAASAQQSSFPSIASHPPPEHDGARGSSTTEDDDYFMTSFPEQSTLHPLTPLPTGGLEHMTNVQMCTVCTRCWHFAIAVV